MQEGFLSLWQVPGLSSLRTLAVTVGRQTGSVTSPDHPREQKSCGLSSLTLLLRPIRDILGEWELDLGMGG